MFAFFLMTQQTLKIQEELWVFLSKGLTFTTFNWQTKITCGSKFSCQPVLCRDHLWSWFKGQRLAPLFFPVKLVQQVGSVLYYIVHSTSKPRAKCSEDFCWFKFHIFFWITCLHLIKFIIVINVHGYFLIVAHFCLIDNYCFFIPHIYLISFLNY